MRDESNLVQLLLLIFTILVIINVRFLCLWLLHFLATLVHKHYVIKYLYNILALVTLNRKFSKKLLGWVERYKKAKRRVTIGVAEKGGKTPKRLRPSTKKTLRSTKRSLKSTKRTRSVRRPKTANRRRDTERPKVDKRPKTAYRPKSGKKGEISERKFDKRDKSEKRTRKSTRRIKKVRKFKKSQKILNKEEGDLTAKVRVWVIV